MQQLTFTKKVSIVSTVFIILAGLVYLEYRVTQEPKINLLENLPIYLTNQTIWSRTSRTRFECAELNLKVDIIDNNSKFRLSGIKDNDELIISSDWQDINYEISMRTLKW